MNGFTKFLEERLMPFAGRVAAQRHLGAVRDGIIVTMPFLIIGSIVLILGNLPVQAWADALAPIRKHLVAPYFATFAVLTILATFAIGYSLAQRYKLDAVAGGMMALVSFFLVTPVGEDGWSFSMGYLSAGGLFVGIICALVAVEIFRFFVARKIVITMPASVPPAVSRSFSALLPGVGVIVFFWAVKVILDVVWGINLHMVVGKVLTGPLNLLGGSLFGAIIAVLLVHVLWGVGIHGASIVEAVMGPIWIGLMDANIQAMQAGTAIPNVVTKPMFDIFVYMGGSGTTIGLALLMAFAARSKQLKTLGRMSVGPGLFNINEPIIFGTPIVMNPLLLIPFILTPIVLTIITYSAIASGLVAKTVALAPWTTPFLFGGLLATGHWSGAALQVFNVVIATAIYFPFFRLWDAQKVSEENGAARPAA